MDKIEAINLLGNKAWEISELRKRPPDKQQYRLWFKEVSNILELTFGETSREYKNFVKAVSSDYLVSTEKEKREKYNKELDAYEIELVSALHKCVLIANEMPTDKSEQPSKIVGSSPKAFIAHEGETRALEILKEFIEALEIKCFIAEYKASDGRSIEKQVDWTQYNADFAIILATKGKAINKKSGKSYMGLNVADELGRARQVFGNKIILLVQKGIELHSNVKEVVYESFTTTNMEKAFIKITKELTNWGFVNAGITKETPS